MLTLPLRQAAGGRANGAEKRAGPRLVKTAALAAGDVFWLALIAALFICWPVSPSTLQSPSLSGESPGCKFVGKAGVVCSARGPQDKRRQLLYQPGQGWAVLLGADQIE
jgi:hypothetical protein